MLIRNWIKITPGINHYRFSGGEPMILGQRLFSLADLGFAELGQKPYVLTAGKVLTLAWAERARKHAISHLFVSIENPFMPDPGAPDPHKVINAIKQCHTNEMPVLPGVCVVHNKCFNRLYDICEWFFEHLGQIPIISGINHSAYESPREQDWEDFAANIERIVRVFHGKTPLKLFPNISPELSFGETDPVTIKLDLENTLGITKNNYK